MRVGVVSDSHGQVLNCRAAAHLLRAFDVEVVLHCGDIGSTDVPPVFAAWPTHYVFGNVDLDSLTLRAAIEAAGGKCHDRFAALELAGSRVAVLHSDNATRFYETCHSGEWDLVCYGHTHQQEHHFEGTTLVLNPGALHRARPHTMAIVELPARNVEIITVG